MTPRKLVWKELWQRPTAMATCLLAIMLGVTALVAIRSVTVYSEKTVAKQMSELGANILLLPKNATLQDYYAADANGETIPEDCKREDVQALAFPFTQIADALGEPRVANMVILGTLLEITGVLPQASVETALHRLVKHTKWLAIDERALAQGRELYRESRKSSAKE